MPRTTLLAVSQTDDDERLGLLLRKLRRRAGQTQEQLAAVAQIPIDDISAIETGQVGCVRVDRVRAAFGGVDGRLYLRPWYMGAAADRLLDQDHAAIVEEAASVFARRVWRPEIEVTFSQYGERGSIDLFAAYEATRTVAVCEIKSAFGSLEETNRSLDVKVRLAPEIAERVFGWQPAFVGRLLIVPDQSTSAEQSGNTEQPWPASTRNGAETCGRGFVAQTGPSRRSGFCQFRQRAGARRPDGRTWCQLRRIGGKRRKGWQ